MPQVANLPGGFRDIWMLSANLPAFHLPVVKCFISLLQAIQINLGISLSLSCTPEPALSIN